MVCIGSAGFVRGVVRGVMKCSMTHRRVYFGKIYEVLSLKCSLLDVICFLQWHLFRCRFLLCEEFAVVS